MAKRYSKANLKPRLNMVLKSAVAAILVKASPALIKKIIPPGADGKHFLDGDIMKAAVGGVGGYAVGYLLGDADIRDISLGFAVADVVEPTITSVLSDAADMLLPNTRSLYLQAAASNYGTVPMLNDYTNFVEAPDNYQSYYGRR